MSPTGRKIHETVLKQAGLTAPVRIGILETPTGFEVNAIHGWPERMEHFFAKGLRNYKPRITRIRAWRRDGEYSTNDRVIVDSILGQNYLYCGAGSPSYTIRHLRETRTYDLLKSFHNNGGILSVGSATAISLGRYALPVYEIFKVGVDLHWLDGLDFMGQYGLNLAIVPHWNNREGEDFDTTRCYMGIDRFAILQRMLPKDVTILGLDEQTACVVDIQSRHATVMGAGSVTVVKEWNDRVYRRGEIISFE
ncbi:cysteinyl-tRNA synthetase [Candidatus Gottesmanbacteria bacterium]|nr:cysteinyl-tRNA synthetase [Candidatus Gottesmanbacteria bacterium]